MGIRAWATRRVGSKLIQHEATTKAQQQLLLRQVKKKTSMLQQQPDEPPPIISPHSSELFFCAVQLFQLFFCCVYIRLWEQVVCDDLKHFIKPFAIIISFYAVGFHSLYLCGFYGGTGKHTRFLIIFLIFLETSGRLLCNEIVLENN